MNVRIAGLTLESVTDGPGIRSVIFFQGCPHACPGCHNPQTWSFSGGKETSVEEVLLALPITPLLSGFTFSGGDPFAQAAAAAEMARRIKSQQMNLWVYTGYTWEQVLANINQPGYQDLLSQTDVLVDGPYRKELGSFSLPYRGSSNQRAIRVAESLQTAKLVEWQPV